MTKVYFIRHCEPNFNNHHDLTRELSEKGMADTRLVTEYLWDKNICVVLSSNYKRAVDTVKPFADSLGLPVITEPNFRERQVDGGWIEDFNSFAKNQWADFDFKLSGGESLREVQERNIRALKAVLSDYEGKNVVIGSHGTALSTIINYFSPNFGCSDFIRIKGIMPWIVVFSFDGKVCTCIEGYDPFRKEMKRIL